VLRRLPAIVVMCWSALSDDQLTLRAQNSNDFGNAPIPSDQKTAFG
jgi:hypothetical protein